MMMTPRRMALAILGLVTLPPAAVVAAQMTLVDQVGRAFSTREIRVQRGDTVRFRNSDTFVHQIGTTGVGFSFASPEQEPGQIIDVKFPVAGTFNIRCEVHPRMALAVSVE